MDFLSANSRFAVQNNGTYLPQKNEGNPYSNALQEPYTFNA